MGVASLCSQKLNTAVADARQLLLVAIDEKRCSVEREESDKEEHEQQQQTKLMFHCKDDLIVKRGNNRTLLIE